MITTLIPDAAAGIGLASPRAIVNTNARPMITALVDRWLDALWAPFWMGNARASSPPEHRAVARDDGG